MAESIENENQLDREYEEAIRKRNAGSDVNLKFGKNILNMFNGFSENFYGNNWFVLSTNEGGNLSAICGVLDEIPNLEFKTTLTNGPVTKLIDKLKVFTGRGGVAGTVSSATGANINVQIAGNYSVRLPMSKEFQPNGFKLNFTAWRDPRQVFDPVCLPSDMKTVVSYLKNYATVMTTDKVDELVKRFSEQAEAGILSLTPILGKAVDSAKTTILDGIKKNVPGSNLFLGTGEENTSGGSESSVDSVFKTFNEIGNGLADFADNLLVRRWNDKQRITYGKEKFNESLHRLDIMRSGVLDTYLIVGIKNWNYQLDQSALGERMKVTLECAIDQRMSQDRLRLYSDRAMFG